MTITIPPSWWLAQYRDTVLDQREHVRERERQKKARWRAKRRADHFRAGKEMVKA